MAFHVFFQLFLAGLCLSIRLVLMGPSLFAAIWAAASSCLDNRRSIICLQALFHLYHAANKIR
jgi:hypothetical protein